VPRGRGRPGAPPPCIRASYAAYRYTARYRTRGLCSRSHANAAAANSSCNAATLLARHYELVLGMDAPTPTHLARPYIRYSTVLVHGTLVSGPSHASSVGPVWPSPGSNTVCSSAGPTENAFQHGWVSRLTADPALDGQQVLGPSDPAMQASSPPRTSLHR
jgi:hypothetical protein